MLDYWQIMAYRIFNMIQGIILDTPPQDGVTIGYPSAQCHEQNANHSKCASS
jgi:hypothetical protein